MEKSVVLKAEVREKKGKKSTAKVRKEGKIPATIYGHKQEAVSVSLDAHETAERLHHGARVLDIQIGKKKEKVMFKDLQYDYLGKNVIHIDLMRVSIGEKVKLMVPIELKGIAKGATEGGVINSHTSTIEVECEVTDIPESIVVSIKNIGVGDTIHAKDIQLPSGCRLISDPEMLIVTCSLIAEVKTTEELVAEEPTAPEVIGEKKGEEEESEEK